MTGDSRSGTVAYLLCVSPEGEAAEKEMVEALRVAAGRAAGVARVALHIPSGILAYPDLLEQLYR